MLVALLTLFVFAREKVAVYLIADEGAVAVINVGATYEPRSNRSGNLTWHFNLHKEKKDPVKLYALGRLKMQTNYAGFRLHNRKASNEHVAKANSLSPGAGTDPMSGEPAQKTCCGRRPV